MIEEYHLRIYILSILNFDWFLFCNVDSAMLFWILLYKYLILHYLKLKSLHKLFFIFF